MPAGAHDYRKYFFQNPSQLSQDSPFEFEFRSPSNRGENYVGVEHPSTFTYLLTYLSVSVLSLRCYSGCL